MRDNETTEPMERKELLERLETALDEAVRKVESGRVYDEDAEKVRVQWIRAVGYLAGQYRQILKDRDLEELAERVEELEENAERERVRA